MNSDRVVVITGAAGGVGSVLVERFLANVEDARAGREVYQTGGTLPLWQARNPGFR